MQFFESHRDSLRKRFAWMHDYADWRSEWLEFIEA